MSRFGIVLRLLRRDEQAADSVLAAAARDREAAEVTRDALRRTDHMLHSEPYPQTLPELLALRMQGIAVNEQADEAIAIVQLRNRDERDARLARSAAVARRRSAERLIERREEAQAVVARRAALRALAELARLRAVQR